MSLELVEENTGIELCATMCPLMLHIWVANQLIGSGWISLNEVVREGEEEEKKTLSYEIIAIHLY